MKWNLSPEGREAIRRQRTVRNLNKPHTQERIFPDLTTQSPDNPFDSVPQTNRRPVFNPDLTVSLYPDELSFIHSYDPCGLTISERYLCDNPDTEYDDFGRPSRIVGELTQNQIKLLQRV